MLVKSPRYDCGNAPGEKADICTGGVNFVVYEEYVHNFLLQYKQADVHRNAIKQAFASAKTSHAAISSSLQEYM